MEFLLAPLLFRLPVSLPEGFLSIAFDYKKLTPYFCDAVFSGASADDRHLKRHLADNILSRSETLLDVILKIIPEGLFEKGDHGWGIAQRSWEQWVQTFWSCDGDALFLFANLPAADDILPTIWAPTGTTDGYHDAHVHLSALPPNPLLWGTIMALGVTGESGTGSLHAAFARTSETLRLKEVSRIARVILNVLSLFSNVPEPELPRAVLSTYADVWNFTRGGFAAAEIASQFCKLFPSLNRDIVENACVCTNCFSVETSLEMLAKEREILTVTISRCRANRIELFWMLDLVVLYLQCKGEWLRSIQGDAQDTNSSLYHFRDQAKRAASFTPKIQDSVDDGGIRRKFDELLLSGFQSYLTSRKKQLRLDLRIALSGLEQLRAVSMWLDRGLQGADTRLFIGLKRRDDHLGRGDRDFGLSEISIDNYFEQLDKFDNIRQVLHGIDVFGFEATTCWSDYLPLMKHAALRVKERRSTGDCVVTFHCGEDPVCSLKGILDMWRNVNELQADQECRISHALALLNPQSYAMDIPINHRMWGEMQTAANQLIRYGIHNEDLKPKIWILEKFWTEIENIAVGGRDGIMVPSDKLDMKSVFEHFREVIADDLVSRGVVIEVCPTSNWRIGHVSSPLKHPIKYWHQKRGRWLVGTDDPCFIPCCVESEQFNIDASLS